MLDLPCHRVIIAQERVSNGSDDGGEGIIQPCIGAELFPKLALWLNPACDYIGETFIRQKVVEKKFKLAGKQEQTVKRVVKGQVEYCLRTFPDPIYTTKFRVPKGSILPDVIIDPDYNKITEIINQGG